MQLVIFNTTAGTLTYLSGAISVTAAGNTAVTNTVQQLSLATDGKFRSDILANNIYITDGTNNFGSNDAIAYLYELVQNIGPNSDGIGNNLTSTTLNSKQRLDVNTASEAVDGAAAPFSSISIAGRDGNGNHQTILTDTTGAIIVSERLALSGSSPAAASVGVASTLVITSNAARRGLVLTNTSNAVVSFNINGGSAVLRSGITLYPGGVWDMDSLTFTTGTINGIASAAASNVAIQELT